MVNDMVRLLLIEDNKKHLQDARQLLEERVASGAIAGVDYAATFDEAMRYLTTTKYSGIMSDIFFPTSNGGNEEENGTKIGEYALQNGLPFVLVTSTYHHGRKTEPVSFWARTRPDMELIDTMPETGRDGEAQSKNWIGGYVVLSYLIEAKQVGEITINQEGKGYRTVIPSEIRDAPENSGLDLSCTSVSSICGLAGLAFSATEAAKSSETRNSEARTQFYEEIERYGKAFQVGSYKDIGSKSLKLALEKYCKGLFE